MSIICHICREVIVNYKLDLGDTIRIIANGNEFFICDDCAKYIAKELIER